MKGFFLVLLLSAFSLAQAGTGSKARAAKATGTKAPAAAKMISVLPEDIKWMDAPPGLPAGIQLAVLKGDPSKPGPFSIRLKSPAGGKVAPHSHPALENLTIISGEFMVGMGDKFDESTAKSYPAGSFISLPARMHHYAGSKGESVVQIDSTGPFVITYVNPSDDPRKGAAKEGVGCGMAMGKMDHKKPAAKKAAKSESPK